ncbi:MAG TPA: TraB/GumN family protein [Caulobacteraceae bacterium]
MRGPVLAALASVMAMVVATAAAAEPAVWTVHGPKGEALLFGSVHLLPSGLAWEPAALKSALASADEIWFELPVDAQSSEAVASLAMTEGQLPQGEDLYSHLRPRLAAKLRGTCKTIGIQPAALSRFKPWMAELVISLAEDLKAGASPTQGVERQISAEAPAALQRRAFETAAEQISFLADRSDAAQIASLNSTLDDIRDDPGQYRRILKEWLAGDTRKLAADAITPLQKASPETYRRLIADRNQRWAARLEARLRQPGSIVVVVGAAHLIGPQGAPELLRRRGLVVDGPTPD